MFAAASTVAAKMTTATPKVAASKMSAAGDFGRLGHLASAVEV